MCSRQPQSCGVSASWLWHILLTLRWLEGNTHYDCTRNCILVHAKNCTVHRQDGDDKFSEINDWLGEASFWNVLLPYGHCPLVEFQDSLEQLFPYPNGQFLVLGGVKTLAKLVGTVNTNISIWIFFLDIKDFCGVSSFLVVFLLNRLCRKDHESLYFQHKTITWDQIAHP